MRKGPGRWGGKVKAAGSAESFPCGCRHLSLVSGIRTKAKQLYIEQYTQSSRYLVVNMALRPLPSVIVGMFNRCGWLSVTKNAASSVSEGNLPDNQARDGCDRGEAER